MLCYNECRVSLMKLQRLLLTLFYLQNREWVRISELTELLEVSRRTIYRDIDELRTAGADIEARPGAAGGFHLSRDFRLEKIIFSNRELMSIIFSTKVLSEFKGTEFARQADEFGERLERIFSVAAAEEQELADRFLLDVEDRFHKADNQSKLRICEEAVFRDISVNVVYESPLCEKLSTVGKVNPFGIINKAGYWFLVGYCHELETHRAFNLTYIKEINLTGEHFSREPSLNLKSFWDKVKPG